MAFTKAVSPNDSGRTPNVQIPSVEGDANDATSGLKESNDLDAGKTTSELLADLAQELDKEKIDVSNVDEDDDATPPGKPAKEADPDDGETDTETPSPDDDEASGDDAASKVAGEVAPAEGEVNTELRALESLHRLPANSLDGFSSVKDAERHLSLYYSQIDYLRQQGLGEQQQQQQQQTDQKPDPDVDAELKAHLENLEPDDPTRLAIESLQKQNKSLADRQKQIDQHLQGNQYAERQRGIQTAVHEFNKRVDGLDLGVFGSQEKGLSKSEELLRQQLGQRVASIGLGMEQSGQPIDYDLILEMALLSPEFKTALAKEQLISQQNGNGKSKQPGPKKKLGSPGRGTSPKDSRNSAALRYKGPVEDNPELLKYAMQRLEEG